MSKQSLNSRSLIPLMLCFFAMGIVDIVGVSTSYIQQDFKLDSFTASFIPMMVFLWFALFSIPAGLLMARIGKRNTVLLSVIITCVALLIPFVMYSFPIIMLAFALMGIANTLLQVSLNPLVAYVVPDSKLASTLTFGQFVKAIASFLGPIIASYTALRFGDWRYALLIFACVSLVCTLFVYRTAIPEPLAAEQPTVTFLGTLRLLKQGFVFQAFLGIVCIVGIDVGMNTNIVQLLHERLGIDTNEAALGISSYFAAKTAGAFAGTFILMRIAPLRFLLLSMLLALAAFLILIFADAYFLLYSGIILIGFCCANVFSIIFSACLQAQKEKANEVSALMIMGVAGGAIVTPIAGLLTTHLGIWAGFAVFASCAVYILYLSYGLKRKPEPKPEPKLD